jgi:NAD(P)-dependent dehydrogenase (short-subunit alcohol dehydrogenase family)
MSTIIVTGSEGVIGPDIVEFLKKENNVICLDKKLGHDLTDRQFVEDFFKENKADVLINLFALNHHVKKEKYENSFFEMDPEEVNEYCNVNVTTLYHVCREFIKNKKKNNKISIINFGSLYAIRSPRPDIYPAGVMKHIGYVTSKHAVIGLTKYIAAHFAPDVRVNCVCPGGIETEEMAQEFKTKFTRNVPQGRMSRVEDLFGIIQLLCSEKSEYMTGCVIPVDGGWTVQ